MVTAFFRDYRVGRYQKGKTNLDFTEARDSEWKWHQLRHIHVCTSLQTDNHASIRSLSFLQAGCPSCRPANSVKALKAKGSLVCQKHTDHETCSKHGNSHIYAMDVMSGTLKKITAKILQNHNSFTDKSKKSR